MVMGLLSKLTPYLHLADMHFISVHEYPTMFITWPGKLELYKLSQL